MDLTAQQISDFFAPYIGVPCYAHLILSSGKSVGLLNPDKGEYLCEVKPECDSAVRITDSGGGIAVFNPAQLAGFAFAPVDATDRPGHYA